MRKLSLLILMLCTIGFVMAEDGNDTQTDGEGKEEGKFVSAMKNVFNKDKADDEPIEGEEEKAFPLTLGLDFVSRYVWRGLDYGASPSIQPFMEYSVGNDKITWGVGTWGNYAFKGGATSSAEVDLYSYLSMGPVSLTFTDYFLPDEITGLHDYFNYRSKNGTGHVYELMLTAGSDDFPLYGTATINVGGADKLYSSYFELGASVYDGIDLFIGAAYDNYSGYYLVRPKAGDYKFNVINVGIAASYDIDVKKVSIPLSASLMFNPEARNVYFVVSIGLSN